MLSLVTIPWRGKAILFCALLSIFSSKASIFTVVNTNISGSGSFVSAIFSANGNSGKDTIRFSIPGVGMQTITMTVALPALTDSVFIDGFSQSGGNTISVTLASTVGSQLGIQNTRYCKIEGLNFDQCNLMLSFSQHSEVTHCSFSGRGIVLFDADSCFIWNNQFTNVTLSSGIQLFSGSSYNQVSTNSFTNGAGHAIWINAGSHYNRLSSNTINACVFAITLDAGADRNEIRSNHITGAINSSHGIRIYTSDSCVITDNTVVGGMFLTTALILESISNDHLVQGNTLSGTLNVLMAVNGSRNRVIGNTLLTNNTVGIQLYGGEENELMYNTFGFNKVFAIDISSRRNVVSKNYIGTNALSSNTGTVNQAGIWVSAAQNQISGNVIGFNKTGGIYVNADSNDIRDNRIGIDSSGQNIGNTGYGIRIGAGIKNTFIELNHIAFNIGSGIDIQAAGTDRNYISKNLIYANGGKAIHLNGTGNNNKSTPYITKVLRTGNNYLLRVYSEASDQRLEIFEGDGNWQHALRFVTDALTPVAPGVWEATVSSVSTQAHFLVSATRVDSTSSELGFDLNEALVVTNTLDGGKGSLRDALTYGNLLASLIQLRSHITFAIPGSGPHLIQVNATPLPTIRYPILIDGFTQADIHVKGNLSLSVFPYRGFYITDTSASDTEIRGLKITEFVHGVEVDTADRVRLHRLEVSGHSQNGIYVASAIDTINIQSIYAHHNGTGLSVNGFNYLTIDSCSSMRNAGAGLFVGDGSSLRVTGGIYSGNQSGITVFGALSTDLRIENNIIGLDSTKNIILPNLGNGVETWLPGFPVANQVVNIGHNYIGGNGNHGVLIGYENNVHVYGNVIGTNDMGADLGNANIGVYCFASQGPLMQVQIGGLSTDSVNVIGFNTQGVVVNGMSPVSIIGNYIGVDKQYRNIGNIENGIFLGSGLFYIGGQSQGSSNVIGNNGRHGIGFNDPLAVIPPYGVGLWTEYRVLNNYIGCGPGGELIANGGYGIFEQSTGAASLVKANFIKNNLLGGIKSNTLAGVKLSQNLFDGYTYPVSKAINPSMLWSDSAYIVSHSILGNVLTLNGQGRDTDSVEVFASAGVREQALVYVGTAYISGGQWSLNLPMGSKFSPLQDNYYVAMDNRGTSTMTSGGVYPLSAPYKVAAYLCENASYSFWSESKSICPADSLLLVAPAKNVSYQWYFNDSPISTQRTIYAGLNGEYKLVIEDGGGCKIGDSVRTSVMTEPFNVDFLAASVVPLGQELVIIDVTYNVPNLNSVVWDFGEAQNRYQDYYYLLKFQDTGYFQVSLQATFGECTRVIAKTISVVESEVIADPFQYAGDFKTTKIYPNPNDGKFFVEMQLFRSRDVQIKIFNTQGTYALYSQTLTGSDYYKVPIDLGAIAHGTYLLKLLTDREVRSMLLVVE